MARLLKDHFVDQEQKQRLLIDADYDRRRVNELADLIRADRYPLRDVEALCALSPDTVKVWMTKSRQSFVDDAERYYVPQKVIDERLVSMDEAEKRLSNNARQVRELLDKYEGVTIQIDSKGHYWLDKKTLDVWATAKATINFSKEDKDYYTLLGAVVDALEALRKYEHENGLVYFSREEPFRNTPSIQNYFKGEREKDPFTFTQKDFVELKQSGMILSRDPYPDKMLEHDHDNPKLHELLEKAKMQVALEHDPPDNIEYFLD